MRLNRRRLGRTCSRTSALAAMMLLMMLAFLVDQAQQIACPLFRAAYAKMKCKRDLWEKLRALFVDFAFENMAALYETIVRGHVLLPPVLRPLDSS